MLLMIQAKEYKLTIVGGPDDVAKKCKTKILKKCKFYRTLSNKHAANHIMKSEIGILLNEKDQHSEFYTSPIKYFEYLRGLKIVAVDFKSHRDLPVKDNLFSFLIMTKKT